MISQCDLYKYIIMSSHRLPYGVTLMKLGCNNYIFGEMLTAIFILHVILYFEYYLLGKFSLFAISGYITII